MSAIKHAPATPLPFTTRRIQRIPSDVLQLVRDVPAPQHYSAFRVAEVRLTHGEIGERERDFAYLAHAANSYPKLIERTQKAPMVAWNPDRFVGFSDDELALMKRGFFAALDEVYGSNQRLLRELGETGS